MKKTAFKSNNFYVLAQKEKDRITDNQEIMNRDLTIAFNHELDMQIKNGEIIKIQINAKPRMGKSTTGIAVAYTIHELLRKHKYIPKEQIFNVESNIAMDQMEYDYKMRDSEFQFNVVCVDEDNSSERTGADSTTIHALQQDQSNIQADRYIHTVYCSPQELSDPNADIILDVISKDEKEGTCLANLSYRWTEGGQSYTKMLGYVIIRVDHIISTWHNKGKKIYYNMLKNGISKKEKEEYKNKLDKIQRKDFYTRYYLKKRKKIELVVKYKITKPRILKYAPVIIKVIDQFKVLTRYESIIKTDIVKNNVNIHMRNAGIPQSILGQDLTTREIMGVLDGYKGYYRILRQISKFKKQFQTNKIEPEDYRHLARELTKAGDQLMANLKMQEEEYHNMIKLQKEYEGYYGTN